MRIEGAWLLCDDGVVRPVIRCQILAGTGEWIEAPLQVDTGADKSAFDANTLQLLNRRH